MPIIGALRIKNEARWIERVIRSILPACEHVLVLDDHSTDETPDICESLGCRVIRSEFQGIDESRDKDFLLSEVYKIVPREYYGKADCPWWMLAIDGDEVLAPGDDEIVKRIVTEPRKMVYSLPILYLWDDERHVRVDGVYRNFARPSLFRLINPIFRYQSTPFGNGANFHCSSIPQEMLHHSTRCDARLLHLGYMMRDDRVRKYEWYNRLDPGNQAEDGYRHMVIGDLFHPDSKFVHGGPLQLEEVSTAC